MIAAAIRILYVDDEAGLLDIGKLFLEKSREFTVTTALSGPDAIRLLEQETEFDVIVSDYLMPEMNGIEFLNQIRGKNNSIPFIIFNGQGRGEIAIEALNAGADFYFQKSGEPQEQFAGLSQIIRNVVRQRRADVELEKSEERYRRICDGLTDYLYTVHVQDGRAVSTTHGAACLAVTGYTAEEFAADPFLWIRMVFPDDRNRVIYHVSGILSGKPVPPVEHRIMRKDGQIRWVRDTPILQLDLSGNLVSYDGVIKDVTERRLAEETLQHLTEFQNSVITNARVWLIVLDQRGKILVWNTAAEEISGYRSEEVIGKNEIWKMLYPDKEYRKQITGTITRIIRDRKYLENFETTIRSKGGTQKVISWNTKGIPNATGSISDYIAIGVDVTDHKRSEEALASASRKLNLLSSITRHDITNQLSVLVGYLRILERKLPDASLSEYFLKVATSAERISAMIQFTKTYESIGVNAAVWQDCHTLVDTAAKQAPLGRVMVKNDLPAGTEVFSDALIVKVFYNLMDNAARYGGKITSIQFSVEKSGDNNIIVCEDDGFGVPAEEKEKIFERGFGKNTGLGLALAREILDITGITIRETGEPGKGARFEMTVPKGAWRVTGKDNR